MKTFAYIVLALNIVIIPMNLLLTGTLTASSVILSLSVCAIIILQLIFGNK